VSEAQTIKRVARFARHSMPISAQRTRSTADAGTQKGHFYRPLPTQFQHDALRFRQLARERDVAIYEQKWTGCADPSISYDVIRIRRREGFQIGHRFIPPAEVYPRSEKWGELGWTFCDKGAAFAKLREITATTGGGT